MNQILEYNSDRKSNNTGGSDKVIKFFAIVLVVFAVILICIVLKERNENNDIEYHNTENEKKAEISVDIDENKSKATIHVNHDKVISQIMYRWGNSMEKVIKVKAGATDVTEVIDVAKGSSTLHIKVVDENGVESEYSEETNIVNGIDIKNPEINFEVTENAKIKIVATDETKLSFITYRWNDEDENKIAPEDDFCRIETEIEIPKGENNLTIIAVDTSNNTTTEMKSFIGRTKPSITVTLSADGSSVNICATDEYGIDSIKLKFNDVDYNVGLQENMKRAEFPLSLKTGNNRIILTVTNKYGISASFDGECPYGENISEHITDIQNNISEE